MKGSTRSSIRALAILAVLGMLAAFGVSPVAANEPAAEGEIQGAECPDGNAAVTDFWYTINGDTATTYGDLSDIGALQGAILTAWFELAEGCENLELTLDANEAAGGHWDTSVPQADFDHATGMFTGSGSLTADVPDCMFQVDFVWGGHIPAETINANHPSPSYGDLKLDFRVGGEGVCEDEAPATTPPTTPATTPPTQQPAGGTLPSQARPSQGTQGTTARPGGDLPDTAVAAPTALDLTIVLAILGVAAMGGAVRLASQVVRRK